MAKPRTQRELAQTLLKKQGIMRLLELREAGVTAATISRMERAGEVIRLSRDVYQLPDADRPHASAPTNTSSISSRSTCQAW